MRKKSLLNPREILIVYANKKRVKSLMFIFIFLGKIIGRF